MRGGDDIVAPKERVLASRLLDKNVDRGTGDMAASSAAARSSSTTKPPRAQLTNRTPRFILAIAAASIMFLVASVKGVCKVTKSARDSNSSNEIFSTRDRSRAPRTETGRRRRLAY